MLLSLGVLLSPLWWGSVFFIDNIESNQASVEVTDQFDGSSSELEIRSFFGDKVTELFNK